MSSGTAPGKVILFGEHAVVYGRPAIAVPVRQVQAVAEISQIEGAENGGIRIEAPGVGVSEWLHAIRPDNPLSQVVRLTLREIGAQSFPPFLLSVKSSIPIAGGLGSGAAVSVAMIRALCGHFNRPLSLSRVNALAFEIEKIHHGTPSGIDNTVVTYDRPVYFMRGKPPEAFPIAAPFALVIADTGIRVPTAGAVNGVRLRWERDRQSYEAIFDSVGTTVQRARSAIEAGQVAVLGPLMDHNQELLEAMGVSSPELRKLIWAARHAGARGAKLSGAGLGGNMVALVDEQPRERVEGALRQAGATSVLSTVVCE